MAEDAPTLDSVIEAVNQRSAAASETADVTDRGEVGAPTPGAAVAPGKPAPTLDDVIAEVSMRAAKERGEQQPVDATRPEFALMGPGGTALAEAANLPGVGGLVREFAKSGIDLARQLITGTSADVAGALGAAGGRARLDQKPLEEVKAERDRIAAEQAQVQGRLQSAINSGTETNFDQIMALSSQNAELERMKKDNDEVLASGHVKQPPANIATQASDALAKFNRAAVLRSGIDLENLLPTTQALDNSVLGKLASGVGTLATLLPATVAGPEVEVPALALAGSGAQYEDALHHGADENTAETAALMGAAASVPQSLSLLPFAGLARKLGGMTPTQAITEIIKGGVMGGAGTGAFQFGQNMVARLSGYDPNRPLDEGVYEQVALGVGLGGLTAGLGSIPGLARYARGADTEVRSRPPPPPQPFAEMPGAFILPQAGAPPTFTGEPRTREVAGLLGGPSAPVGAPPPPLPVPTAETVHADQGKSAEQRLAETPSGQQTQTNLDRTLDEAFGAPEAKKEVTAPPPPPAPTPTEAEPVLAAKTPAVQQEQSARQEEARREITPEEVRAAYDEERKSTLGSAVMIAKIGERLGVSAPEIKAWMEDAAKRGEVTLDVGHWPSATEGERAAAADFRGEKRLSVRYTEPEPTPAAPSKIKAPEAGELDSEQRASHIVYDAMSVEEKAAVHRGDPATLAVFSDRVDSLLSDWHKQSNETPRASVRADLAERENPDLQRQPDQAEVKQTTNDAADRMGLNQVVHYVPNAEALPERVKKTLSATERTTTAQTVWDNSMGELWVVGDRFDSVADLHRALIEETQGRIWRDVADIKFARDPNDNRLGYYDIGKDQPVLNLEALLRSRDPFGDAARTAIHEVAIHKGISRLYGSREATSYVDAMNALQRNFDRGKLNDVLAQEKGFKDLADMAKRYGYEDYESNPRHQHALSEELAGAYAERFGTREALEANAPRWYQTALETLTNGIRRKFGMQVSPLDMQHLLADSMAAMRVPKYGTPGAMLPEQVMDARMGQLSARRGEEPEQLDFLKQMGVMAPPPPPPVEVAQPIIPPVTARTPEASAEAAQRAKEAGVAPGGTANIGNLFVKSAIAETVRGAERGEGQRQQATKLALQQERDMRERMDYTQPGSLLYQKRQNELNTWQAQAIFDQVHNRDVHATMADLMREHNPTPVHSALREIVGRATNAQIDQLWANGLSDPARSLALERDRFNQTMQERVTGVAQELADQKRFTDGSQEIGKLRAQLAKQQQAALGRNSAVKNAASQIKQITLEAAQKMANRIALRQGMRESAQAQAALKDPTTLAERYIKSVAEAVDSHFARSGFNDADRPLLQQLFNTFQGRIQDAIREGVEIPESGPKRAAVSPTESIRNILSNIDMFNRTWTATVDQLKTENPNAIFFANLDRALAQPFGEKGVRGVIGEANKLSDLVLKHYSTQDRIGSDLARSLVTDLGLEPLQALRTQQAFDTLYRAILKDEQGAALQRSIDALTPKPGGKPAKGELARLIDGLALGGFDNAEWLNLIAPRHKVASWTEETLQGIKSAGDMLQQMRDAGVSSPSVRDRWEAQIEDMLQKSQSPSRIKGRQLEAMYMSGMLTGEVSHASYFLMNAINKALTFYANVLPDTIRSGDWAGLGASHMAMIQGFQRALSTDIPRIMQTGISSIRELHAPADTLPFRSALEATPIEGRLGYLNNYKYVTRALMSLETFSVRGVEAAMQRHLAGRLAEELGYHGSDAIRFADQAVYGTEEKIAAANRQSLEEQARWGFDERTRRVREQEILDQLKSTSDNPDTSIADTETEALHQIADQAQRLGIHAAFREDVPGFMGVFSRVLQDARQKNPALTLVIPFNKLPMNVANEFLAWTPLGVWRGRDTVRGGTEGIQSYYGIIPGWQERAARGEISDREMRYMAREQFVKGMVGTAAMGAIGAYLAMNKDNPDPFFWITGEGPPTGGGRDVAHAEGFLPFTIKVGNTRWSYGDTPLKAMFGMPGAAADYMRYTSNYPTDAGSYFGAAVSAAGAALGMIMTDTGPLQGLATALSMAGPGSRAEKLNRIENQVAQTVSQFALTPVGGTFWRQSYRLIDPRQFEAKDLSSIFIRNIPVVNSMFLQPKLNILGEPVRNPPLARLPFVPISETGATPIEPRFYERDPVWEYIEHTGLHIQLPGYTKKIDGVAISPAELHVYHEARGKELKSQLAEAIQDPAFTSQSLDEQNKQVKTEFERAADSSGVDAVLQYREQHAPR